MGQIPQSTERISNFSLNLIIVICDYFTMCLSVAVLHCLTDIRAAGSGAHEQRRRS